MKNIELDYEGWSHVEDIHDSFVLAQIEVMMRNRYEGGKKVSKKLNIPFATEGYSHFKLRPADERVLSNYLNAYRELQDIRKHLHVSAPKGIHVETFCNLLDVIKNPKKGPVICKSFTLL